MPELDVWRALVDEVDAGRPCALVAVVASRGSSPGRRGAVMAVGQDGLLAGTIGGGAAESGVAASVAARLGSGDLVAHSQLLEHREGAIDASGMVCGGSQTVAISPISRAQRADLALVVAELGAGRRVGWSIDEHGWRVGANATMCSGPTHTVHLIGAGHVGQALSQVLVDLDFRVVLIDERPGLLGAGVGSAHERRVVAYEQVASVVAAGPDSYAAIMTHAHDRDAAALAALRDLELGYLGLLGSRAKVRRIVGQQPMPEWFHAPMGIAIGSVTPAEIAVSVAAEMVALRSAARDR